MGDNLIKRRGPRPKFCREDVIEIAVRQGIGNFSLSSVARELGITHTALYREVASNRDLETAVYERIISTIEWKEFGEDWKENLHTAVASVWDTLEQNPGMSDAILRTPGISAKAANVAWALVSAMVEDGISRDMAMMAIDAAVEICCAAHTEVSSLRALKKTKEGPISGFRIQNERWAEVATHMDIAPDAQWQIDGWLHQKVDLLIAGLEVTKEKS